MTGGMKGATCFLMLDRSVTAPNALVRMYGKCRRHDVYRNSLRYRMSSRALRDHISFLR